MPKYWSQINELIDQTLALEPEKRIPFLTEKCSPNDDMLHEALDYLSFIEMAEKDQFLESDLIPSDTFTNEISALFDQNKALENIKNKRIGPYQIKELLGEGGMGTVYLAERADGGFEQKVAVKFLRAGFFSMYLRERFNREKKMLSRLHHPNITRLLDGGISKDGSPYFVMEYIEGQPIHTYCTKNKLALDARLQLFLQICDAVQHAHSRLVVHRDLKPDNILVTSDGQVHIMDFGIGKLLPADDENQDSYTTKEGHFFASFDFSAPEQLQAGESSVKTDVYGLGTLLYLLITEEKAFDFSDEPIGNIRQAIQNCQPVRPKNLEKASIGPISADLEAIVLKALRKHPEERYISVTHFQEDIRRYQNDHPVLARKGTLQYRAKKFIKRHAARIAAAVLLAGSVAGFTSYHVNQLTKERNLATREAEKVTQIKDLMIDIFSANNPASISFANTGLTVSRAMALGIEQVKENIAENPEVYTELLSAIGTTLTNIEDYENAYNAYMFALEKTGEFYGNESARYSTALANVANFMNKADSLEQAREYIEKSIEVAVQAEEATEMDIANRYGIYGLILGKLGDFNQARHTLKKADSLYVASGNAETIPRYNTISNLADLNIALRNYDEAEAALTEATTYYESVYDSLHVDIVTNISKLGYLYARMSKNRLAEEYLLRALELRKQIYGEMSSYTATSHSYLFTNYRVLDEHDKALYHATKQAEISKMVYGEQSLNYGQALNNLALAQQEIGNLATAGQYFEESIRIKKIHLPENSTYLGISYYNMANLLYMTEQYPEALNLFKRVLEIDIENYGEEHAEIAIDLNKVAVVQRDMGDFGSALLTFQQAGEIFRQTYPETHYRVAEYHMEFGKMYQMQNSTTSALGHFEKALDIYLQNFDESHSSVQETREYINQLTPG